MLVRHGLCSVQPRGKYQINSGNRPATRLSTRVCACNSPLKAQRRKSWELAQINKSSGLEQLLYPYVMKRQFRLRTEQELFMSRLSKVVIVGTMIVVASSNALAA